MSDAQMTHLPGLFLADHALILNVFRTAVPLVNLAHPVLTGSFLERTVDELPGHRSCHRHPRPATLGESARITGLGTGIALQMRRMEDRVRVARVERRPTCAGTRPLLEPSLHRADQVVEQRVWTAAQVAPANANDRNVIAMGIAVIGIDQRGLVRMEIEIEIGRGRGRRRGNEGVARRTGERTGINGRERTSRGWTTIGRVDTEIGMVVARTKRGRSDLR
jgi:hypothetical protein